MVEAHTAHEAEWLRIEELIRAELRSYRRHLNDNDGGIDAAATLSFIDNILGRHTGRGYEL